MIYHSSMLSQSTKMLIMFINFIKIILIFKIQQQTITFILQLFHIFYRIMSVNKQNRYEEMSELINHTQEYLYAQLKKYRTYLTQSQNQIQNTITMHLSQLLKQQQLYKNSIAQLQNQVIQLKDDNSYLRNQFMNSAIKHEQLEKSRLRLQRENDEKEERMRQLAKEVQSIKKLMNQMQNIEESTEIVDFDEIDSPIKMNKYDCLETIKEVSEHDLSMTMSLQSFKSQILEDYSSVPTMPQPIRLAPQQQVESKQSLDAQNCQIQNYQDALMILKSYNSCGRAMKMTKKPNIQIDKTCVISDKTNAKVEKKGNQTINRIKKMRKIEDADIDSKVISKSNQQNICFQANQPCHQDQSISIVQSKIQYIDQGSNITIEDKSKSSLSINSTKFVSRVKQNLVDLQDPIKKVTQILHNINAANSHPIKKQMIKEKYKRISYVGGLQFMGNCDQHDQPSGFGKLLFNKEIMYQGEWRCGKFHGWGKLILISFAKGKQKAIIQVDGHFKQGMMQGSVVCTFSSGQKFMGMIKSESIEKQGTFVSEKGIMTGYWQGSKLIYLI